MKKVKWVLNPEWVKLGPEADVHFCFNHRVLKKYPKNPKIIVHKRKSSE